MPLPFNRAPLTKSSLSSHLPLFQSYLHHHKHLVLASLSETELRGRWKSFIGKWNRGELGEEWYTHSSLPPPPSSLPEQPAEGSSPGTIHPPSFSPSSPSPPPSPTTAANNVDDSDDSDSYGPVLPPQTRPDSLRHGPKIPTRDDLTLRNELLSTDRQHSLEDHRYERKSFRTSHKELLEELAPKADPGSRERKLEKKRELTAKLRGFAQAKEDGVEEVNERDLMGGGGDDALEELKRMKMLREQRQNQRQSKRDEEEMLRRQEREERVKEYKEREERVMEGLRGLVRERFGGL
ncbi:hypothetical protein B0T21DRAFT_283424 [Apiosordaria backusii]|uniref:Uncharacterized protein n=1 Tax=Apiosordaria backusii TaxID=314023 RepID=A0AA40K1G9_9PEZI|nr:hypothetical protein B0T21DRAFT_283424 [Apiosordaria backusii]